MLASVYYDHVSFLGVPQSLFTFAKGAVLVVALGGLACLVRSLVCDPVCLVGSGEVFCFNGVVFQLLRAYVVHFV